MPDRVLDTDRLAAKGVNISYPSCGVLVPPCPHPAHSCVCHTSRIEHSSQLCHISKHTLSNVPRLSPAQVCTLDCAVAPAPNLGVCHLHEQIPGMALGLPAAAMLHTVVCVSIILLGSAAPKLPSCSSAALGAAFVPFVGCCHAGPGHLPVGEPAAGDTGGRGSGAPVCPLAHLVVVPNMTQDSIPSNIRTLAFACGAAIGKLYRRLRPLSLLHIRQVVQARPNL